MQDLSRATRIARGIPIGGIPMAGYLADHCYLLCEAISRHIHFRAKFETLDAAGGAETLVHRAEVMGSLGGVRSRLERLYSSERPGGLDQVDQHLSRLNRSVKSYFAHTQLADPPAGGIDMDEDWWAGMSRRRRAYMAAWVITARSEQAQAIFTAQPRSVRIFMRFYYFPRVRSRFRRLGWEPNGTVGYGQLPRGAG